MKVLMARVAMILTLLVTVGCGVGQPARYVELGDMLPCELISLEDGSKLACQVEFTSSSQRGGVITATNPVTNETFSGQYMLNLTGGGSSTGVVRNSWGLTTGTVQTTSSPNAAGAMGFLKGDKGSVIEVSLDMVPTKRNSDGTFLFFNGHGTGTDNQGVRYQIYFGY